MGVDRAIDITAKQRKIVTDLLERHLPNTTAWVYGSRAKWTSRPQSDLDLVVFATPEQNGRVFNLREAFEESNLPFRVDLFVWDAVPEEFREHIKRDHVVLVEREERDVGDEWREAKLGDLLAFSNGKSSPRRSNSLPHPVYGSNGIIGFSDETNAEKNTIIVGRVGSYCGSLCYSDGDCWVTDNAIRANAIDEHEAKFLFFLLQTLRLNDWRAGSGQPLLNQTILSSIPVTVPPLPEQRAIAHILGTLDDKIELNRRMNETLEAMARALFKSWFVDFGTVRAKMAGRDTGLPQHIADLFPDRLVASELGEIPKGWNVGTLEDVASLNPESWSTRNAPEKIVYVDLSNTKWGYIEKVETYSWKAAPSRGRRVLRHGDTIVGTVRPGNGSFSLVGRDGLTGSTGFAVLRPKTPSDAELVWCAATSQDNIDRLAHLADGGAYPAVRPEAVAATKLPLADFATRGAFSSVAASLLNQVDANKQQSHTLADLRDTLLPRLISGELRAKQIEPESSISNISPDATGVQA